MQETLFVGTRADLEPGIRRIEAETPLKYIPNAWHSSPTPEEFHSALDIPLFGQLINIEYVDGLRKIYTLEQHYDIQERYLVCLRDTLVVGRKVQQDSGRVVYVVNISENKEALFFSPGGMLPNGELLGGAIVNTKKDNVFLKELVSRFGKVLVKGFPKQRAIDPDYPRELYHVGPEAMEMLKSGVTLRSSEGYELVLKA